MGDWPLAQFESGLELGPPLDVRETDDAYIVEIDLPGIDPKNTEVLIEGRTLTIRGRFEESKEEERGTYLVRERRQGQFVRAVALPGMVEIDRVTSHAENGRLTITLPKASQNRARRIEVQAGDGNGHKAGARQGSARPVTSGKSAPNQMSSSQMSSSQTASSQTASNKAASSQTAQASTAGHTAQPSTDRLSRSPKARG
jgi:HSP20 family protein